MHGLRSNRKRRTPLSSDAHIAASAAHLAEQRAKLAAMKTASSAAGRPTLKPATLDGGNPLRPSTLDSIVGQAEIKPLLRRIIATARESGQPLPHVLLVGDSGTGKTTFALAIAREMDTRAFVLKAPVDMATLLELQRVARDGDVVFCDEIHLWTSGDRRGRTEACDPESVFTLLEDSVLMTPTGTLPFPKVTWIGATTDVGLIPVPLVNRFPIQPHLSKYSESDMAEMARRSMTASGAGYDAAVPDIFARASRGNPRQLNSYVQTAKALGGSYIAAVTATEAVVTLSGTTLDGLNPSMQAILRHLYRNCRRETRNGVEYVASAGALATAAGHGRDVKIIYTVESYLIERGLLTVQPKGRMLTPAGIERARTL